MRSAIRLGQVLDEAKPQDEAVAVGEGLQGPVDGHAALDELEALLYDPERLGVAVALLVAAPRRLEGDRVVGVGGVHGLDHLLVGDLHRRCDLGDRGGAAERAAQLRGGLVDLEHALLHAPGHVHSPAAVAKVALELAEDRRDSVAREGHPALGVEAVHRLDQADARDLEEVVEGLVGSVVAAGELARQGHEAGDRASRAPGSPARSLSNSRWVSRARASTFGAALARLGSSSSCPTPVFGFTYSVAIGIASPLAFPSHRGLGRILGGRAILWAGPASWHQRTSASRPYPFEQLESSNARGKGRGWDAAESRGSR